MTMTLSTKDLDTIVGSLDLTETVLMKAEDRTERAFGRKASNLLKRFDLNPEDPEVAVIMTPQQARVLAHLLVTVFAENHFAYASLPGSYAPGLGQADRTALRDAFDEASS